MHVLSIFFRLAALIAGFVWCHAELTGASLDYRYTCALVAWIALMWGNNFRSWAGH